MEKARSRQRGRAVTVLEDVELPATDSNPALRPPPERLPSERIRDALRRWFEQEL